MKKTRLLLVLATMLIAALAFTACRGGDDDTAVGTAGEAGQPAANQPGGGAAAPAVTGGTVVHVSMSEAPFMDAIRQNDSATADITSQMFEGLVRFTPYPYNEIVGALATSWQAIGDGRTWEFNLRQGVYFHDGSYFNADVMAWSLQRPLDTREASPGLFIIEMIESVEAIDTYTLHITTEFPFTPLIGHLSHPIAFAISPNALANEVHQRVIDFDAWVPTDDDDGEDRPDEYVLHDWQLAVLAYQEGRGLSPEPSMVTHRPVGTGPFMYDRRVGGDYTRLVPNPNHWRATPQIDELIFRVVPDSVTRFAMLIAGEGNSLALQPVDVAQVAAHPQLTPLDIAGTGIDYIGFNVDAEPLDDVRVRHALTYALNVESVIHAAFEGIGIPAVGPIGPNVLYSPHDHFTRREFNPARARELLAEAGLEDGFDLRFWYNQGNAARRAVGEIAQAYWAQIGVNLTIETVEWGTYLDHTAQGLHDTFILGWTTVTGDPDYGTISLFHTDFIGAAGNRTFFSNAQVDALLDEGRMSTDSNRRREIYRDLTEVLIEEAPWLFIRHPIHPWASNNLNGFAVDFNNRPVFFDVTLAS